MNKFFYILFILVNTSLLQIGINDSKEEILGDHQEIELELEENKLEILVFLSLDKFDFFQEEIRLTHQNTYRLSLLRSIYLSPLLAPPRHSLLFV
jgi:hypothetical protein